MAANLRRVREAIPDVSYEIRELVDLEGTILVRVAARGSGATTGIAFEVDAGQVWVLRDGKAVALDIYPSWDEAKAAAGVD